MRVLHLDAGKAMRGGQWQALRLVEGLSSAGIEATLLARSASPLLEAARKQGIRAEPLGLARAALLARRSDLVHAHDARSHTIAALAGGAPLIVSRRVAFASPEAGFRAALSKWKYARANRYIAVSEFVKALLVERGVPEEKISVVYDGVPVAGSGAAEAGGATRAAVVAPAYDEDPGKGTALATEGARLAGVELTLSTELGRNLPGAAVFLYITHCEGLGSGVLMAMAAGVPVVASKVGGLTEIVRHGENGLLVENTVEAIASAVRQMLTNPELARRFADAGVSTVRERFTVEHMLRRTMEVYRQVLS